VLMCSMSMRAQTQDSVYFNQLPSATDLASQFGDAPNRAEVSARRGGVLVQMADVVLAFAASEGRDESKLTRLERLTIAEYRKYAAANWEAVEKEVGGDRARLVELERYKSDRGLLMKVLSDFTSPALVARYQVISAAGAASPTAVKAAGPAALPATTKRPTGTANAMLTVVAPISVSSNDTLYLLDDDLEHILTAAGFKPQVVLGQQLSLLQTLEVTARMKAQQASGAAAVLEAFGGSSALSAFGLDFAESNRQYQVATQAIAAHTVGTTRAAAGGPVRFPAVPAGTYWIWTTHEQAVTTGVQGTVIGSTVMVTPTGYQRPMMWNLKTTAVAGGNSVSLTQANAAWIGQ